MGASGKALKGAGKVKAGNSPSAHVKDGGHGLPLHPLTVRSGQRYFPRGGKRRRHFQIGRIEAGGVTVHGRRLDGTQEKVRVSAARLLETRPDGQGRYYAYCGLAERRYKTYAVVVSRGDGDDQAHLILPEWHPGRPVTYPARLLPPEASDVGAWMTCTAELHVAKPAELNLADLKPCPDPGPAVAHRPTYQPPARPEPSPRPDTGRGCGDIVLELSPAGLEAFLTRGEQALLDVFLPVRTDESVRSGSRVYLARPGAIAAYLEVVDVELLPNGNFARCRPEPIALPDPIPCQMRCEASHWFWRWWPRDVETGPITALVDAAAEFDLEKHSPDYPWVRPNRYAKPRPDWRTAPPKFKR